MHSHTFGHILLMALALAGARPLHAQSYEWLGNAGVSGTYGDGSATRVEAAVGESLSYANYNWGWNLGGTTLSGTYSAARRGSAWTTAYGSMQSLLGNDVYSIPAFNGSGASYLNSIGGVSDILQFYSGATSGGTSDSTAILSFRFDPGQSSLPGTLISLFDPGDTSSLTIFSFIAYLQGAPVDTSMWTYGSYDAYTPNNDETQTSYSSNGARGTATVSTTQYIPGTNYVFSGNYPGTIGIINTNGAVFDSLSVMTFNMKNSETFAIGLAAMPVPEPSGALLLAASGALILRRRSRLLQS